MSCSQKEMCPIPGIGHLTWSPVKRYTNFIPHSQGPLWFFLETEYWYSELIRGARFEPIFAYLQGPQYVCFQHLPRALILPLNALRLHKSEVRDLLILYNKIRKRTPLCTENSSVCHRALIGLVYWFIATQPRRPNTEGKATCQLL